MRRRGTWCMLPRSRAGETLGRAIFCRKTPWFQHTFPLSPESGPGGSREIPDAFRGLLGAPPGLSGGAPRGPSGILLPGLLLQVPSSGVPPQGVLLRIPLPGLLPQDSTLRSLLKDSSSRISLPGVLLDSSRIPPLGFLLQDSCSRIPPPRFLFQDSSSRIPPLGFLF